jgi:hypothetical protein
MAPTDNVINLRDPLGVDAPFSAGESVEVEAPSAEVQTRGDTRIPNRVIDHPAFCDLNSYAVHLLLLLHHRHRHPGVDRNGNRWRGNNGRIMFSRSEAAEKCGVNRRTATKAFKALEDGNFIQEMKPARFDGQDWTAPEWRINYLPCQVTNRAGSFAFRRCEPAVSRCNPS